jgi:hypothetical protein
MIPLHVLTYVDRPNRWPTVIRADLYARAQRYAQPTRPVRHWIVTLEDSVTAADCARWDVRTDGLVRGDDLVDASQILIDRLLMENRAYAVGERIFFRWAGCKGYQPARHAHGREQRTDLQLWGPHWPGGPVGPSRVALRWAAIFELAEERVDCVFGLDVKDSNAEQLVALGCRIGAIEPALVEAPSISKMRATYRNIWSPDLIRWNALQVRHAFAPAQGAHASSKAHAARHGVRMRGLADNPPAPEHMRMLERAETALARGDWRDAAQWILGLCKIVTRMPAGYSPSRRMRNHVIALIDALGL